MLTTEEEKLIGQISKNTIRARTKEWMENFFCNLPHVFNGMGTIVLLRSLQQVPIIIVGAGPSLDKNVGQLKELRTRACIVACDAALEAVLNAGCRPHLVVSSDSKQRVQRYLKPEDKTTGERISTKGIPLIADTRLHPDARDAWEGPILWYLNPPNDDDTFSLKQVEWAGQIGFLGSGGCVTSTIWCLSVECLGTDPNIFIGQDCSFKDTTNHHASCVANTEKYTLASLTEEVDIYGEPCFTNNPLKSFLLWFEDAFCKYPGIHINSTEGGLLQRGCLVMPLEEAAKRYCPEEHDIEGKIQEAMQDGEEKTRNLRMNGFPEGWELKLPAFLDAKKEPSYYAEGSIENNGEPLTTLTPAAFEVKDAPYDGHEGSNLP